MKLFLRALKRRALFACASISLLGYEQTAMAQCVPASQAQVFAVAAGTNVSILPGTLFNADSLTMQPTANFILTNNSFNRNTAPVNPMPNATLARVYSFGSSTNAFSGSLFYGYQSCELNGLTESNLRLSVHNGSGWLFYTNSSNDLVNKNVSNTSLSNLPLKELSLGTCIPITAAAIVTDVAEMCKGYTTNLRINITGGTAPYTVVYKDGNNTITLNNYQSGSPIAVSPSQTNTYTLVSVTSATFCEGTGIGAPAVLTINNFPVIEAGNGGSACVGSALSFSVTAPSGCSFQWDGPNGFSSTAQNPTIVNATLAAEGLYAVQATYKGCTSYKDYTYATINKSEQLYAVNEGTTISVASGTLFNTDKLTLQPTENFAISNNSFSRNLTVTNTSTNNYIKSAYKFSSTTTAFTGSAFYVYQDCELNGLAENNLRLGVHNGNAWRLYANSVKDANNNTVSLESISAMPLNEILVGTCVSSTAAVLSRSGSSTTICAAGSANLSVAIAGGIAPFTLVLNDGTKDTTIINYTSGSNIVVHPSQTSTYTLVSVTGATGCEGQGLSGTVAITTRSPFTSGTISSDGEIICYGGEANPALIVSTTAATGGDAIITYKWQANGVDIVNSNSANYNPPAGLTVSTTYTRFAKDETCNSSFTPSDGSYVVTMNANYTISASVGANGIISSPGVSTMSCDGTEDKTYTITPDAGYLISDVKVDGMSATLTTGTYATGGTYVFTDVQTNHTISVTFALACSNVGLASATAMASSICADATTTLSYSGLSGTNASVKWTANADGTGITYGTGSPSNPVGPGTYYAYASGDCGSAVSRQVVVVGNPLPSLNIGSAITPACGATTADLTVGVVSNGTVTYYSDNTYSTPIANPAAVIVAQTYYIRATLNGCTTDGIRGVNAFSSKPSSPTASATAQPTCSIATGTITVSSSLTDLTFSIDGSDYTNTTGVFTGLTAGAYSVTAKNGAGCISLASSDIVINAQPATPIAPVASATAQPTCSVATGTITVSSSLTGLTFSIDGSDYTNTTGVFTGLTAGAYSVTAKNGAGCISLASADIVINAQPAAPSAPVASVTAQPTCSVATGTITVSSSLTGLTFSIDGSDYTNTTGVFTGLTAGAYSVTAKNGAGCISLASSDIVINAQPAAPAAPVASATAQPTCSVATGTITVSSSLIGLTFSIDGLTYTNTTGVFTGLSAGSYSVTAKNGAGCISLASSDIVINAQPAAPAAPVASATAQPTCSIATGTITVSSSLTGLTFSIDGSDYSNTSGMFTGLTAGTYSVTAKNGAGCISLASSEITINAQPATPAAPVASATAQPTCSVATGTITVSSSLTGLTFSIDGSDYTNTTGVFTGLTAGTYTVTAKNGAGCISLASSDIVINAQPATPTSVVSGNATICAGTSTTISIALTGSQPWSLTYTDGTTPVTVNNITASPYTFTVTPSSSKTYTVTALSDAACSAHAGGITGNAIVTVNPSLVASVSIASNDADNRICVGTSVMFTATPTNGGASPSYQWQLGGVNINGATSSTYITTGLTNGNQIRVLMTAAPAACLSGSPATSNAITTVVNALPAVPTGTAGARCGPGTVVLVANAVNGTTVDWYAAATGGSVLAGGSGVTRFTTPSISTTTTYYAERRNTTTGCVSATRVAVVATVNAIPVPPSASNVSRCGAGTVTLSATAPTGATVAWFNVATGGTALSTANPYTTANINATTTYYVESRLSTCSSPTRTAVVATVVTAPAGTAGSRCGPGSVTLSASTPFAGTIEWYATNTSTTALSTGNTFTTPSISATTTYFAAVRSTVTNCLSPRTAVAATINAIPATPASINGTLSVCPVPTTGYTFTTPNVNGATYLWTLPACAIASTTPQSTARRITVRFPGNTSTDSIKVQVRSNAGCLSPVRGVRVSTALNCVGCAVQVTTSKLEPTIRQNQAKKNIVLDKGMTIKLFPNPSQNLFNLNVKSTSEEIIHVRIMSISGSVLEVMKMNTRNTLSLGRNLRPGIYLVEVRQGEDVQVLKAIKL